MAKNKSNSSKEDSEKLAFISDLLAQQKGISTWKTLGTAGREPVGNLRGLYSYIQNKPETRAKLKLEDGEINPYLTSESEDGNSSKSMFEYWASAAMPQLPKELKDQYDVVFAGTRPREPRDFVWNTKYGDNLAPPEEENIWKFIPKTQPQAVEEKAAPAPIAAVIPQEHEADRPVTVGTTVFVDPSREEAGQEFLSRYVRSVGVAPTVV